MAPGLPDPREHLGVASFGGRVYVLGGRGGGDLSATTEVFNPKKGSWRRLADMPTPRGGVAAGAVDNGFIVVPGGEGSQTETGTFDEVEAYDVHHDRWLSLPPMPTPRHGLGVVGVENTLYTLSGGPRQGFAFSGAVEAIKLQGLDELRCLGSRPTVVGSPGRDVLTGTEKRDVSWGSVAATSSRGSAARTGSAAIRATTRWSAGPARMPSTAGPGRTAAPSPARDLGRGMRTVTPSHVTNLTCSRCGATHDHKIAHNLCDCGGPLLVNYDLEAVGRSVTRNDLTGRAPNMWRYRELLPVEDESAVVSLGEGFTPLLPSQPLAERIGVRAAWVKDDGLNPTGTFKARGAACGVTRARELGIGEVALPTAGNAGGAWAAYGAAAGMKVHVAMPKDAPEANRIECLAFGAELTMVDGLISDAGKLIAEGVEEHGWFDCSTLKEPYRIEGKKTLGLEIAEQLGWIAPDAIVYPAGGGVGAIGIHRAFEQIIELGWVTGAAPRIIVVQASGCAPLVKAFQDGKEQAEAWPDAETLAAGLRVPKPLGDALTLRAARESGGTAIAVDDAEILEAMRILRPIPRSWPAPKEPPPLPGRSVAGARRSRPMTTAWSDQHGHRGEVPGGTARGVL